jgi:SAM-dependent methyltransferase
VKELLNSIGQRVFSANALRRIVRYTRWPPIGWVRFGSLRRLNPISFEWGSERGLPIDRYYIKRFLSINAHDIYGHVLEIGTDRYTREYGGDRVRKSDVLHVAENKPQVTIIGDLTNADHISSNHFDCIILTQTLQTIYDVAAAVKTIFRILKPGGVVLATVPGISKISRYDMDHWGYYWSFTTRSVKRLFEALFLEKNVHIESYGNVLAAISFLHGVAMEELKKRELDYIDPDYELLITIRAVKPESET